MLCGSIPPTTPTLLCMPSRRAGIAIYSRQYFLKYFKGCIECLKLRKSTKNAKRGRRLARRLTDVLPLLHRFCIFFFYPNRLSFSAFSTTTRRNKPLRIKINLQPTFVLTKLPVIVVFLSYSLYSIEFI